MSAPVPATLDDVLTAISNSTDRVSEAANLLDSALHDCTGMLFCHLIYIQAALVDSRNDLRMVADRLKCSLG